MKINIEFYGRLKNQFSQSPITWQTSGNNVAEVYHEICQKYQQKDESSLIKPILNDTFCEWHQTLKNNDSIGFFPPAAGG
jgi:molybdopterin converting factor small subunit